MYSKMRAASVLLLLGITFFFSSCEKDAPVHSAVPEIELVGVSPVSVAENENITFTIKYTDGDGDLGEDKANVYNLFLTDTRINITYQYRIRQLAPENTTIAITGTLNVKLNSTAITDGSSSQQVVYTLYVVDRAGNKSNVITCPALTVHK